MSKLYDVLMTGGPYAGQTRQMSLNPHTGLPGAMGCVDDAKAAGLRGVYRPNRKVRREPFELVWHDVEKASST